MEAQLKALKVPELKAILQKAGIPVTGKKDDLIARIIASPSAVASLKPADATASPNLPASGPDDDLAGLAPPQEFDWGAGASNGDAVVTRVAAAKLSTSAAPPGATTAVSPSSPVVTATPAPSTSTKNADPKPTWETPGTPPQIISAAESTAKVIAEDDEITKRRARAARFGVPFVEPTKPAARSTSKGTGTQAADPGLEAKKTSRAARFGLQNAGVKPPPSKPSLDIAEEEKKRKRAERFGLANAEGHEPKKSKTS